MILDFKKIHKNNVSLWSEIIINKLYILQLPKIIRKEAARTNGKAEELNKNQKREEARVQKTLEPQMAEKLAPEKRHSFIHNGAF